MSHYAFDHALTYHSGVLKIRGMDSGTLSTLSQNIGRLLTLTICDSLALVYGNMQINLVKTLWSALCIT